MSEETEARSPEYEANRPYRRFVGILFALAIAVLCILVLRGIVRHLDRLPSAESIHRPSSIDVRALRACAEDLDRLSVGTRRAAGRAFSEPPGGVNSWSEAARALEIERVSIVARCRLDESNNEPALKDLALAAEKVEGLLRSYSLLLARHKEDGLKEAEEAQQALERANNALRGQ